MVQEARQVEARSWNRRVTDYTNLPSPSHRLSYIRYVLLLSLVPSLPNTSNSFSPKPCLACVPTLLSLSLLGGCYARPDVITNHSSTTPKPLHQEALPNSGLSALLRMHHSPAFAKPTACPPLPDFALHFCHQFRKWMRSRMRPQARAWLASPLRGQALTDPSLALSMAFTIGAESWAAATPVAGVTRGPPGN